MRRLTNRMGIVLLLVAVAAMGLSPQLTTTPAAAQQANCHTFPETRMTLCGRFLQYWTEHGGLAQQGYPISAELTETSDVDGRAYTVQYFDVAVVDMPAA